MNQWRGLAMIEEFTSRFQRGDKDGALALLHPDFEIEQPASLPHGGVFHGAAGMAEMGARFAACWDRTIASPRLHGDDELVVQLTTQTWTAKATGRSATVDVVELFTFRDRLLSAIRVFQQDTALLMATLDP